MKTTWIKTTKQTKTQRSTRMTTTIKMTRTMNTCHAARAPLTALPVTTETQPRASPPTPESKCARESEPSPGISWENGVNKQNHARYIRKTFKDSIGTIRYQGGFKPAGIIPTNRNTMIPNDAVSSGGRQSNTLRLRTFVVRSRRVLRSNFGLRQFLMKTKTFGKPF